MSMFASVEQSTTARCALAGQQRKQRNFLRENKQQLRLQSLRKSSLPTTTAQARKSPSVSAKPSGIARGIWNAGPGARQPPAAFHLAEKQIQTEDINDEQFLNEALRKCADQGAALTKPLARSEDDDMQAVDLACSGDGRLRRTCSAIELGRVPTQRGCYLPGQYTLQRPMACVAGIVPGSLDQPTYWTQAQLLKDPPVLSSNKQAAGGDNISIGSRCSGKRSLRAVQMAIPEFVDVEHEPELGDRPANCTKSQCSAKQSQQQQQQQQQQDELTLLTEPQRLALIDGARARQHQLIEEYNRLPIVMRTLRVRNLKIQLEQQLDMIDNDLNMLSKRQVFVKRGVNLNSN